MIITEEANTECLLCRTPIDVQHIIKLQVKLVQRTDLLQRKNQGYIVLLLLKDFTNLVYTYFPN